MYFTSGDYFFVPKEVLYAGEGFFEGGVLEVIHCLYMPMVAFVNLLF